MQFDKAEFETPVATAPVCAVCKAPVGEEYFEINGHVVCGNCKGALVAQLTDGSGAAQFGTAVGLGALAAAVGAVVWYLIVKLTHYEIGLIAIGVGFLVGAAVRKGAGGRGGTKYQLLAVFLTYAAMVAYYVPFALDGREGAAALISAIVIAFAAPFLQGFQNAIGILILGFALYEAWKMNKKPEIAISGPFKLKSTP